MLKIKKCLMLVICLCIVPLIGMAASLEAKPRPDRIFSATNLVNFQNQQSGTLLAYRDCVRWERRCRSVRKCVRWGQGGYRQCYSCFRPQSRHNRREIVCGRGAMQAAQSRGFYCNPVYGPGGGRGVCVRWISEPVCERICIRRNYR